MQHSFYAINKIGCPVSDSVNSEIFARILFSRMALKKIFVMFKIRNYISSFREDFFFMEIRICKVTPFAKFRENKTLAKISAFTVLDNSVE